MIAIAEKWKERDVQNDLLQIFIAEKNLEN